jgi:hypothetical protein
MGKVCEIPCMNSLVAELEFCHGSWKRVMAYNIDVPHLEVQVQFLKSLK